MLLRHARADGGARPALRIVQPPEAGSAADADLSRRAFVLLLAMAVFLGIVVRAMFVLASDFPLGDGGLFYQMVRDLQHAGYALPSTTAYNDAGIPYAYPPLAMYAAGLLDSLTPLSLFDVFRVLPLLGSALTILAVVALARDLLSSRMAVAAAVFCFAMVPRSFTWLIMGGGLTRSFGMAFAILTIHAAFLLYTRRERRFAVSATLFASLALLSHIEMTWFAAFSSAIFFLAYGRHRTGVIASIGVCAGVAALTSPWWATVMAYHGIEPFIAAMNARDVSSTNPLIMFIDFKFTSEMLFPVSAALGLLGSILCVAERRFVLPGWLLATALLDARAFGTVGSVPLALLAAVAFTDIVWPIVTRATPLRLRSLAGTLEVRSVLPPATVFPAVVIGSLMLYTLLTAMVSTPRTLTGMSVDERAAMSWSAANTPAGSRFLVVTADQWALDRTSEWLPALTGRVSVTTPQGYEWTRDRGFGERLAAYNELQNCANDGSTCIDTWASERAVGFDYLYIPKLAPRSTLNVEDEAECCGALRASLRGDARYETVFDGPGATIFRRRS